jgi:hypothetical protein
VRVYDVRDKEGRVFAFEIANSFRGRRDVVDVISAIPGARVIRSPKFLSLFREEEFCEFELEGDRFVAWEPFGDNSRYWIGAEPPRWLPQLEHIRAAFQAA